MILPLETASFGIYDGFPAAESTPRLEGSSFFLEKDIHKVGELTHNSTTAMTLKEKVGKNSLLPSVP